ncbi:MAG TPA: histidine kinase [Flavisolibacter sp.]|nr:histidine kinase [Flavisolibacter sp.]
MYYSLPFIKHKKECNVRIGFHDTGLMVAIIPVLSFVIPIVFFGVRFHKPVYYTWEIYLHTFLTTTAVWIGNRYIMIWARNQYPDFEAVRQRLMVQSGFMLVYTFAATNILSLVFNHVCNLDDAALIGRTTSDLLFMANSTALFCTVAITAIYESKYFMSELTKSVEEKELLKRESLNAQLDALRTQINPHFLFNNLNTLTAIIPEDADTAVKFVQQLSKVYRHILEVKDEPCIPLKEELSVLNSYAFLLQTRFGKNLSIRVDIPEEMLVQKVPPLSLQLLLENAIKHNIVSEDHPLFIHVYAKDDRLVVSNNLQLKKQVSESMGIGLDNIHRRSRMLTEKVVEVIAGPEKFIVTIPLIQN